jgi:hypothetical protein
MGEKWAEICPAPGIEPRPSAWEADTIGFTLRWCRKAIKLIVEVANAGGAHMILVVLTFSLVPCA